MNYAAGRLRARKRAERRRLWGNVRFVAVMAAATWGAFAGREHAAAIAQKLADFLKNG